MLNVIITGIRLGNGRRICTFDLMGMSHASYYCSIPQWWGSLDLNQGPQSCLKWLRSNRLSYFPIKDWILIQKNKNSYILYQSITRFLFQPTFFFVNRRWHHFNHRRAVVNPRRIFLFCRAQLDKTKFIINCFINIWRYKLTYISSMLGDFFYHRRWYHR